MINPPETTIIDGLFVGPAVTRWPGKPGSAIQKDAVLGAQTLTRTGFAQDQQADRQVHGGETKAVHHYAADHYGAWQDEGLLCPGTVPAAFGENISTHGMIDTNVFIGDVFRMGTALVQISQGRQPCWKLNAHTGHDRAAYLFQKMRRTGWYYRVLEPGLVQQGDTIALLERPNPQWSVADVTHARLSKQVSPEDAAILAQLPELASGWRAAFAKMAAGQHDEDNSARLNQPKAQT